MILNRNRWQEMIVDEHLQMGGRASKFVVVVVVIRGGGDFFIARAFEFFRGFCFMDWVFFQWRGGGGCPLCYFAARAQFFRGFD